MAGQEENPTQSWDAFWAEVQREEEAAHGGPRTEDIRGVTVTVPTGLPLSLTRRMEELQDSDRLEDVAELLTKLFGEGVYEAWVDAGMETLELQVVLAWAVAQGTGQDISFRRAYEIVRERQKQGKALAQAARTRSRRSAGTGGR